MSKQIEEMAKIICKPTANKGNCEKCGFKRSCSKFDDATDLYNAGYRKQEWIPVTERLPESRKFVIVCDEFGNVVEAYFYKQDRKFEWVDDEETAFASHWMPLPLPPEKENEDG